jgi:hypothetical protein
MREFGTVLHGLILGSLYLLAFAGGAAGLWSLRPGLLTEAGVKERLRRLKIGVWTMTVTCWLTVISGTYIVYVWYRAKVPESPRSRLLADPMKADWHTFGMEWKEHVAWLSPILSTAVAFLVIWYGPELLERQEIRKTAFWLFAMAFAAAAIAGLLGAFINKVAPIL